MMMRKFNRGGATAIEYALIASFIAIVIVVALTAVGQSTSDSFGAVSAGFGPAP